jgi:hypothetical protein
VSDRIDPIGPHPATANAIPAIRRTDGSTEGHEREDAPPRKRRPPPPPPPPPDDGLPHIDVRV